MLMSESLKAGDVVQLKSGGVLMTIESITDGRCLCIWADDKKTIQQKTVAIEALEKLESPRYS